VDKQTLGTGNKLTATIIKGLKRLVKQSVQENPDDNDKTIKDGYGQLVKKKLEGLVLQSPK